jgi:hypothetical protein
MLPVPSLVWGSGASALTTVHRCYVSLIGFVGSTGYFQCEDYDDDCTFLASGLYSANINHRCPEVCEDICDVVLVSQDAVQKAEPAPGLSEKKDPDYEHEFPTPRMRRLSQRACEKQYVTFQARLPQPDGTEKEETVHALLFTYIVDISRDRDSEPRYRLVRQAYEVKLPEAKDRDTLPRCFRRPIALTGKVEPQLGGNYFKITDGDAVPAIFVSIKTRFPKAASANTN